MPVTRHMPRPANADAPSAAGSQPGHNRPDMNEDALASFRDMLDQRPNFDQRCQDVIASAERAVVTDDETMGRCGDLVRQIRACMTVVGDAHTEIKKPYLEAGRALDGEKNRLLEPLDRAKRAVEGKQSQYLREQEQIREAEARRQREAEQARQREEAERAEAQRAEAGSTEAPAPPPEPAPAAREFAPPQPEIIRGDFGASVSGRQTWKVEILDIDAAYLAVRNNAKVREAIEKAVGAMVRSGEREIDGCRIYPETAVSNR